MVMTRTPDEIKKGLECCSNVNFVCNEECPYYKSLSEGEDCCLKKNADALDLIQQLEKRVIHLGALNQSNLTTITMQERTRARLQEQISQLEADLEDMTARYKIADDCAKKKGEMNEKLYAELSAVKAERDAAVADLEHVKDCDSCKYDDACFTGKKDCFGCHEKKCPCLTCQYEWRGVQKEE